MSPLIVRTIDVPAAATLAVLNEEMLILFGWSGEHLHEFTIRAVGYSTDWAVDADDSRNVTLDSLGLRRGERFCWAYDFFAGWVSTAVRSRHSRHGVEDLVFVWSACRPAGVVWWS